MVVGPVVAAIGRDGIGVATPWSCWAPGYIPSTRVEPHRAPESLVGVVLVIAAVHQHKRQFQHDQLQHLR